jgi:ADP-ribose pyrophosphatase YjhB (NUDIX family)
VLDTGVTAKPAAAGLVVRDGRLLLVRRAHEPWCCAWCAPAGFCDADEHPILAAEREIQEEAGIAARVIGYLGVWTGVYGESGEWISVAYCHAEPLDDGPPRPDRVETDDVRWVSLEELPADDELAPPDRFPDVLRAWRAAHEANRTQTELLDRPT